MTTMTEPSPEDLPAVALEPETLPNRPLTVDKLGPLLAKEIG